MKIQTPPSQTHLQTERPKKKHVALFNTQAHKEDTGRKKKDGFSREGGCTWVWVLDIVMVIPMF